MPVQVELYRIIIREIEDQQFIVLKEVDGDREFPIIIGANEALAIDRRLKGIPTARPLTHDLLANVIEELGGTIDYIEINDLQAHTFFARINIKQNGHTPAPVKTTQPSTASPSPAPTGATQSVQPSPSPQSKQ